MSNVLSKAAAYLVTAGAVACLATGPSAANERISKDMGPASASCDSFAKGTAAWSSCVGAANARMSDEELFYAGYWLAKSGQYQDALRYLSLADKKDERVLTYIGFATRKLGRVDEALPLYREALTLNPDYVVARAYMGEAFLTKGEPAKAQGELAEIADRCGMTCPSYVDLKAHIDDYEAGRSKG